ncbi:proteinaceous RNase P 1, chloroplastic/mitochondrial isoform X1 [Dendrobium catenatum]|uniref:proteinaceous RNase P 1, chloroplastic/mitochondrial isoform X1 n=2 Tax=Dendrobium catenatum TaxID=906689 RepID=UPI00109FB649|nr:proteinaceous RNase P 1, chloroplastic/mitochondrial isoform X1 [Dendrobium catenatum]
MPLAISLRSSLIRWPPSLLFSVTHGARRANQHIYCPSLRHNFKHLNPSTNSFPLCTTSADKRSKKARRETPENLLRHQLDLCSKHGDVSEALRLYDSARAGSIPLSLHQYNVLLYLCSHPSATSSDAERALDIFRQMSIDGITPNEATFTTLIRLAAARGDPDLAFQFIKTMSSAGITPRLRSYGPALFGFCNKGDVKKAHQLEFHMVEAEVAAEELELAALFRLNSQLGRGEDVYRLLHRMRTELRNVSETTAELIEAWFQTEPAARFGFQEWDVDKVNEGVSKGGGGWHGQGWLGKGPWSVGRSEMDKEGVCRRCGDRMICIDIDPVETEVFARSLAQLASKKEVKADFAGFQAWLDRYGPFDAVIDGANVGLNNQHKFSFSQLNYIVNGLRQMSSSEKLPLVVLHCSRVRGGPADNPNNKRLLESWRRAGALYATPPGSNDDCKMNTL